MAIRVAHIGTGNVGRIALSELIENPGFELTGLCVSADEKVGKDAGELAGLDVTTGILATKDLDAVLATEPECAVYCAMGDNRMPQAMEDVRKILAAGINVVGSAPVVLQYPWHVMPDKYIEPLEEAGRLGNSSIYINGVDPGFVTDLIPLAFASTCQSIEQVRCMEIADYATYDGAIVMFDVMGFGKPLDEVPMLFQPGVLGIAWGCGIRQLAAGLNISLDSITESYEREPAPEAFDVAAGHIAKGGVAAVRFEIKGMVGDHAAIVVEHVTRLREDLRPDWAQPAQPGGSYRVEITGEPSYTVDICPTSTRGDHNYAAIAAGAGRIVNAIPAVIAAPPGIRTTLNLPLVSEVELFAKP
ncbi:diacylglycerol kinase [Mycolicibacterium aromaticivorans JS19b1 = JCM 16368]|uniref:Diacylglycerol kinase n=1 Tax=Mycolicibacterium aromaticivorans JS19b1 = JCM 16368 TaxID=1440774 RepID=A0A064CPI5_9MYCO|nr:diacylglycerol kinase [Mycolicibacterium aromaticivorans]KDF02251.1 diacylglycerol kinase [Mycolicibacterium aromaticivorans JS19b1 = JCM 16368]